MAKTDPRPYQFVSVGPVILTVTEEFTGLSVVGVSGGTVTRISTALQVGDVLAAGDSLTMTPAEEGGTVTFTCEQAGQEFSGEYADLDGKPAAGGGGVVVQNASGSVTGVANTIIFANGTLTLSGGVATYTAPPPSGGGSGGFVTLTATAGQTVESAEFVLDPAPYVATLDTPANGDAHVEVALYYNGAFYQIESEAHLSSTQPTASLDGMNGGYSRTIRLTWTPQDAGEPQSVTVSVRNTP